jgi:long-chain fatty acid transport protein
VRTLVIVALLARTAGADPLDTFGFGARGSAMAGAQAADARGAAAVHANPAGVALAEHAQIAIGWSYGHLALTLNGSSAELLDAHGSDIGVSFPIRAGAVRMGFGLALYLPDQFVGRVQIIPATEPHFILLDNDVQRLVVEPVFAVSPAPWLSLGVGFSLLSDVSGGIGFNVGVVGGQPRGDANVDVTLPTRVAPLAGVLVMPHPRVRLGASFRDEVDLSLRLGILADVDVAGVVTGDALIDVRAVNYFTPRRVTGAVSVDVTPELTVAGEVAWLDWSSFHGGAPDVRILVALGITPPLVSTLFPADSFHDSFVARLGAELRTRSGDRDLALRAGYSFEPSPVPAQVGLTSFADNDRHMVSVGGGIRLPAFQPILSHPVSFDLAVQWHHLRERLTIKDQNTFPGQAFSSGGNILRGSFTMSVEL